MVLPGVSLFCMQRLASLLAVTLVFTATGCRSDPAPAAVTTTTRAASAEDALAWALYRNGQLDEARASIARARRLGTPDACLVHHEGAIRLAAGEAKKGRRAASS